jgi:hypothetical protein
MEAWYMSYRDHLLDFRRFCSKTREFRKEKPRAYRFSAEVSQIGHAKDA